jgi:hypothetical protein
LGWHGSFICKQREIAKEGKDPRVIQNYLEIQDLHIPICVVPDGDCKDDPAPEDLKDEAKLTYALTRRKAEFLWQRL